MALRNECDTEVRAAEMGRLTGCVLCHLRTERMMTDIGVGVFFFIFLALRNGRRGYRGRGGGTEGTVNVRGDGWGFRGVTERRCNGCTVNGGGDAMGA